MFAFHQGGYEMAKRFNPPPNWPLLPEGWTPPPGWSPDPAWPPVPAGWQLWVEDDPRGIERTLGKILLAVIGGIGLLLAIVGVVTGGIGGALVILGLTVLVLGLGAVIIGRSWWALIGSRKTGAALLAAGGVTVIIGAIFISPATPTVTQTPPGDTDIKASAQAQAARQSASAEAAASAAAQAQAEQQAAAAASAAAQAQASAAAQAQASAAASAQQAPAPAPAPENAGTVKSGEFCEPEGAVGVTVDGTPMVCKPSATDSRNRWRAA